MSDLDLKSAVEEVSGLYQQRPISKKWNDPTRQEMIDSLNKAHSVNKTLVAALNKALLELMRERKWRKWLWRAIAAIGVTVAGILKWLIPYAIKGMLK